jgi:hypothetical protein
MQSPVETKEIRKHRQDKHDAAPAQRSPQHKKGPLAVLSLLLPFQALPVAHCGSEAIEHLHVPSNFNRPVPSPAQAPTLQ